MCYTVPPPMYFTWQFLYDTTTSAFHLAMCHTVPRTVQPSNMTNGITTGIFHLAMCHMVPRPVYFTWHYVIRYHDQCISPCNMSYVTTTSVFHLAMYHTVPVFQLGPFRPPFFKWRPVPFSWHHALFQSLYVFFNQMYRLFWRFVMIAIFSITLPCKHCARIVINILPVYLDN